ncbi:MAG: class I SAM-dependent methyltransferase [Caldimonas sp.]|nr:class I SAM-dependent methyltransferase [Pseudomonadota bacterium]
MNDLEAYFRQNTGRRIHKWMHYFEIYDRHFAPLRGRSPVVVEFGVSQGGSLQMWQDYFGPGTRIYGVDINPECRRFDQDGATILIGDQGDRVFLREVAKAVPPIDILIDDGGHMMEQQIATFEELFRHVKPHGVYLCEDLHTSYWRGFGGGVRRRGSFIEYSKDWIDALNAWHSREPRRLDVAEFTRSAHSLHYYDSVLVIEKRPMQPPHDEVTGITLFPDYVVPPRGWIKRAQRLLKWARGK